MPCNFLLQFKLFKQSGHVKTFKNSIFLTILLCPTAQISFAQSGFTLTGGYNMSKIKYKDDNDPVGNLYNDYKGGFNIGLEKHAGNLIVGASFLQRGSTLKEPYPNGFGIFRSDLYNYGAAHLLFSTNLDMGLKG